MGEQLRGMRRRSSIPNAVNAENPLFSVPASRQNRSGAVAIADSFRTSSLSTPDESESISESESASISNSSKVPAGEGLMSMSARDLRRPSFRNVAATTLSRPTRISRKPLSLVRAVFSWHPSRRMTRVLRLWFFALLSLFLFMKSLDFIQVRLKSSPQIRELFEPLPPSMQDQLKERMRRVADAVPRPSSRVESSNRDDFGGSAGQVAFQAFQETDPRDLTREKAAGFRKERLWAAPREEATVHFANPVRGQLHQSTMIFLHGMRQQAAEAFLPVNLHKEYTSTRWVLPQANNRTAATLNTTFETVPSWFDLILPYEATSNNGRLPHLFPSVRILNQIIRAERALLILRRREARAGGRQWTSEGPRSGLTYPVSHGPDADGRGAGPVPIEPGFLESFGTEEERRWASKRIVLAGFSQGSVVSLLAALSGEYPLGGVAVFSGFLPLRGEMPTLMQGLQTKDLPVFWGHGADDEILTLKDAITSVNLMRHDSLVDFFAPLKNLPSNFTLPSTPPAAADLGMSDVTFRVYPSLGHSWCHDEVKDLKKWLSRIVPKGNETNKAWS